jgi:acetylornithine deacetylase
MERLVDDLVDWIEIPSVTGEEGDYGDALVRRLEALGFDCERQEVLPGRFNVLARAGRPEVVLCTHLDTVPPYFGARREGGFVYGRGSCDAKGQAAVMIEAGRQLLERGEERLGFLFTVGEEVDGCGATFADDALGTGSLAEPWTPRHVIVGEPTGGRFVRGHKGIVKVTLLAEGVAGHSSQDIGPSAVHELVRCAHGLLSDSWGQHPVLGPGTLNVGVLEGGVAANVVADRAHADIVVRTVEEPEVVLERIRRHLGPHVRIAEGAKGYAPVEFHVPADQVGEVVAFGTDAPFLRRWGTPLLCGPGSILDAHTDDEKVGVGELEEAVARHVRTVEGLLAATDAGARGA